MRYLIRADLQGDVNEVTLAKWLESRGTGIAVHENPNGNPHFHAWLESDTKCQALRVSFKTTFKSHVGNKSYSIKEDKKDEASLVYLCKGPKAPAERRDPIVIWNTKFTADEVRTAHEQYWRWSQERMEKKTKPAAENPKEKVSAFAAALGYVKENMEKVREELMMQHVFQVDVKVLISITLEQYYQRQVKCQPNDFQLKAMTNSVERALAYGKSEANGVMWSYNRAIQLWSK